MSAYPLTKLPVDVAGGINANGQPVPVDNGDMVTLLTELWRGSEAASLGILAKSTWAELSALTGTNGQWGRVVGPDAGTHTDPVAGGTVDNEGEYIWYASPGPGWKRVSGLARTLVHALNVGVGSANAVQASSDGSFSKTAYKALISVNFTATNTGAVTLSIDGETPRNLVTNTGAALTSGYIKTGMAALVMIDSNGDYRLFSYGDAAAIQAACEAAQIAAEAARDAALAAVANAFPLTRTAMKGYDTSTITNAYLLESGREGLFTWKTGDYSSRIAADTAEGIYIKADAVAATSGAWVRVLLDSVWRLRWFGIVPGGSADPSFDTEIAAMCALGEIDKPTAYQFEDGMYNLDVVWPAAGFQIEYRGVFGGGSANTILNWRGIDATGRGVIHGSTHGYVARFIIIRSTEPTASAYAGFSHTTPNVARIGELHIDKCSVSLGDKVTHSVALDGTANNGASPIGERAPFMSDNLLFGAADSCVYGASVRMLLMANNNIAAVGGTGTDALKIRGVAGAYSDAVTVVGGFLSGFIDLDKLTRGDIQTGVQMTTVKNTADVSGVVVRGKSGTGAGVVLQHNWADDCYYDVDENYLDRAAARVSSTVADQTGDGTSYTVIFDTLGVDTANYPMVKCYDTATGKYTALVSGYHSIKARVSLMGLTSSHTAAVLTIQSFTSGGSAVPSGRRTLEINPYAISVSGRATLALSADVYMSAGHYIQVAIAVSGGTKVVDIRGSLSTENWTGFEAQLC